MALGAIARSHEGELRADLQQHYGIDWDDAVSGRHSPRHIAALIEHLPQGARLRCAYSDDARWTGELQLLAGIYNSLNALIWGMSDKRKRGSMPAPVGPSYMTAGRTRRLGARVMDRDSLMAALSKERRG